VHADDFARTSRNFKEEKPLRRNFTFLLLLLSAALSWSACGGNSNTSGTTSRDETETTVNSERIDSSNMAPTGGPGPEPESSGTRSSGNANESKADNKNKTENKAENKNKNTQ
jgi:hypothetical protein